MTAAAVTDGWAPWRAAGVLDEAISGLVVQTGARPEHDLWLKPGVRTPTGRCRVCWELVPIRNAFRAGAHRRPGAPKVPGSSRCDGSGEPVLTRAEVDAGRPPAGEQGGSGSGSADPAGSGASGEGPVVWPPGLHSVPIEALRANPHNPRRDVGDVAELTASIKAHGVLQALVAEPDPADPSALVLLAGHRRLRAAAKAGLAEVPVDVRPARAGDVDERQAAGEQIIAMLAENLHRADLTPVEEGDAYEQLRLLEYSPKQIAAELGRRKATVDRRLALRRLPEPVRQQVHAGQVTLGDAEALVEFSADVDVVGRLVDQLGTPNFRWTVETERKRREQRRAVGDRIRLAAAAGVPVVRPATYDWQWQPPTDGTPAALARLEVDDHDEHQASCPGRALVVYAGDTQAVAGCTEPSRHGLFTDTARGGAAPGPADPQAAARADAARQLGEELEAAAAVRADWLRHLLAPSTRPRRDEQAIMLRQALLFDLRHSRDGVGYFAGDPVAELLGLGAPDPAGGDPAAQEWAAQLETRLAAAPVERVVQVLWALLVLDAGAWRGLTSPYQWSHELSGGWAAGFLDALTQLGYQACDVEKRMLAEHAAGEGD